MDSRRQRLLLIFYLCLTVLSGSVYSVVQKFQNETKGYEKNFDHPYIQSFLNTIGEMFALVIYYIKERRIASKPRIRKEDSIALRLELNLQSVDDGTTQEPTEIEVQTTRRMNKLYFAIPAWLDIVESVLKNVALTLIVASIVQMLRSTIMVYCALLAYFFLKKRLYRHQITSMFVIILGVCLVGLAFLIYKETDPKDVKTPGDIILGLILLQVGQFFGALSFVAEEKFLGDADDLDPLLVVGYEGIAGFCLYAVLLPIFQFVKCDSEALCTNGVIEDSYRAIQDYQANPVLLVYSIVMVLDVCILNVAGVSVTKYGSSAQRATCDMMRNLFVWIVFMTVPVGTKNGEPNYLEQFTVLQLVGFTILVIGVLVYNEILIVPYWGFDRYTKIAIEERERIEKTEHQSIEYVRPQISGELSIVVDQQSDHMSDRALSSHLPPIGMQAYSKKPPTSGNLVR